jgi:NUMOD3 motif
VYRYIGLTTMPLVKRFVSHNSSASTGKSQQPVHLWMRKYPDAILCEVIEECTEGDFETLKEREVFWINHYRTAYGSLKNQTTNSYTLNVTDGGDGALGLVHTEESKKKQSASISGELHWNYGRKWDDAYKEKQRIAHLGQPAWNKGLKAAPFSEEHRRKISEGNKGKKMPEDARLRMIAGLTGQTRSEESKARIAEVAKNRPQVTCTHCPKTGSANIMKRWHFDNCKHKTF